MYNEGKKTNWTSIVIIILLIILIGVGGVLIYQNFSSDKKLEEPEVSGEKKEDNNNKEEKTVVNDLSLSSTVVQELSSLFYNKYNDWGSASSLDGYTNYFYKNSKIEVSTLSNEFKVWMTLKKDGLPDYITEDDLKEKFYNIFGTSATYVHMDSILSKYCTSYKYNNGGYTISQNGCGGESCGGSRSKLLTAQEITENNSTRIEIIEAVAFEKCPFVDIIESDEISEFYKDSGYSEFVEQYENKNNPLDEHAEKYAQYKYTFVKNSNDVYAFTSVERIK